jgi:protocatechuate 3,4-dioxygenase beta subunit
MDFFIGRPQRGGHDSLSPAKRLAILMILVSACLAACSPQPTGQALNPVPLTPAATQPIPNTGAAASCSAPASLTVALTEGPYFKAGSPERTSLLESNTEGTKLVLSGYVLATDCSPVAHALLDFWQADAKGQYDNSGYTLRGHQFTDATGHYQLTTIIPGLYPGRTEHIHVKVQAPGGPVLTTQLFFPGVTENQTDGIFDPSLVLALQPNADGQAAGFNFIITSK